MVSVVYGILTALCWGTADFIGGYSSRRAGAYWMTLGTVGGGLLLLIPALLVIQETQITTAGWLWSMAAGGFDTLGLLLLYMAMTSGRLSLAAPVSALTSASIPVVFGMATQGIPSGTIIAGLMLSLAAIWLLSHTSETEQDTKTTLSDLYVPLLAGACYGIFLVLMRVASPTAMVWPMIAVRCGGVALLILVFAASARQRQKPISFPSLRPVVLTSMLDVGGNSFYILAGQYGRLDVTAVLSCLFPAATVFLAWLLLKETISKRHLTGILSAFIALVLLTL